MRLRELLNEALQDLESITQLPSRLRIISKLQNILMTRKRRRSIAVAETPKLELVSGNEVLSYNVGCWRASIIETKPMEFTYIVRPLINEDFFKLAEGRLDDIIALMRRGNDIADVLVATLKIPRDQVPEALFALRSIVGYRQLEVFLQDPYVTDIAVNGAGAVWVKHGYLEKYPNIDFIQ
jgi:hypothetical protein